MSVQDYISRLYVVIGNRPSSHSSNTLSTAQRCLLVLVILRSSRINTVVSLHDFGGSAPFILSRAVITGGARRLFTHCEVAALFLAVSAAVYKHVKREELGARGRPHDWCL